MNYADALRLLEIFKERDYAQGKPHLYIQSPKSGNWVRPKGMRIMASSGDIGILDWETEQWEVIPFKEVAFGLW